MPSSYTSTSAPAQRKDSMTAFAPIARKHNSLVKTKILFPTLLTLALFLAGYAQTLDKAKLDQFFDRLAEKNKAMGSLTIAKDGNVLYTRAVGYSQINGTDKKPLTAANRYRIGVYSSPEVPVKFTITRKGATLFVQP